LPNEVLKELDKIVAAADHDAENLTDLNNAIQGEKKALNRNWFDIYDLIFKS
jgi:hypothetical protein